MKEALLIQLEEAGNRISELVKRFAGNEMICVTLVKKFPTDPNFSSFMSQIKAASYKDAEQSVHTLKGVASNLGLTKVADITKEILEILRGDKDVTALEALAKDLEVAYQETIAIIQPFL